MVLRDQIGTQIDSTANLVGRMYEAIKENQCMIRLSKILALIIHIIFIINILLEKIDVCTVIPHHWHRIPVRHSTDQHDRRHLTHLELLGRFPS